MRTFVDVMTSHLSILLCASILKLGVVDATACETGWFGSLCQYRCRCTNNSCTTSGGCAGCAKCERGWFGAACQTEDLARHGHVSAQPEGQGDLLTDDDDDTCVTGVRSLHVIWNVTYPFTWMRLTFRQAVNLENLSVVFKGDDNGTVTCSNRNDVRRSETTFDIACDVNVPVGRISVICDNGTTVDVCSFHVSGGQNVALRQVVNQSSVLVNGSYSYVPELAVDGRKDDLWKMSRCSHTVEGNDTTPYWEVNLSRPARVSRYVIYNRRIRKVNEPERPSNRLWKFHLRSYFEDKETVFDHKDNSSQSQYVYTVMSWTKMAVSRVKIVAAHTDKHRVLSLCEVEIFGETEEPLEFRGLNDVINVKCFRSDQPRTDHVKGGAIRFPVTYVAIAASVAGVLVLVVVMVAAMARRMSTSSGAKHNVSVDNISVHELHSRRWDHGSRPFTPSDMPVPECDTSQGQELARLSDNCIPLGWGDTQPLNGFIPTPPYINIMRYSKSWGSLEDNSSDSSPYANAKSAAPPI